MASLKLFIHKKNRFKNTNSTSSSNSNNTNDNFNDDEKQKSDTCLHPSPPLFLSKEWEKATDLFFSCSSGETNFLFVLFLALCLSV